MYGRWHTGHLYGAPVRGPAGRTARRPCHTRPDWPPDIEISRETEASTSWPNIGRVGQLLFFEGPPFGLFSLNEILSWPRVVTPDSPLRGMTRATGRRPPSTISNLQRPFGGKPASGIDPARAAVSRGGEKARKDGSSQNARSAQTPAPTRADTQAQKQARGPSFLRFSLFAAGALVCRSRNGSPGRRRTQSRPHNRKKRSRGN